jgi:hypothetical protein
LDRPSRWTVGYRVRPRWIEPDQDAAHERTAFGCSVSPNGDLVVGNFDVGSAPGSIQAFKNASGSPKQYTCPSYGYYEPPGYDGKGNLYVEVLVNLEGLNVGVYRLPSRGTSLQPVKVNVTINSGGSAMWDGKYITFTEVNYKNSYTTAIYQTKESPSGDLTERSGTVGKRRYRPGSPGRKSLTR